MCHQKACSQPSTPLSLVLTLNSLLKMICVCVCSRAHARELHTRQALYHLATSPATRIPEKTCHCPRNTVQGHVKEQTTDSHCPWRLPPCLGGEAASFPLWAQALCLHGSTGQAPGEISNPANAYFKAEQEVLFFNNQVHRLKNNCKTPVYNNKDF